MVRKEDFGRNHLVCIHSLHSPVVRNQVSDIMLLQYRLQKSPEPQIVIEEKGKGPWGGEHSFSYTSYMTSASPLQSGKKSKSAQGMI